VELGQTPASDGQGPITVLIVDDHSMVAESFRRALALEDDLEVVAVAATAAEARAAATAQRPDVVLMDYALPDADGASTAAALLQERPATKIILVTGSEAADAVRLAIGAGCVGYLEKTMALSQLAVAIRAAAAGETAISPEHLALALRPTPADDAQLTRREREVLALVATGLSNQAIADQLVLSLHTVRTHVQSILAKLGLHSKLEAATFARDNGLVRR
jgi:NarL family two-component system response regulator LiaR